MKEEKILMTGNEAIAEAAISAGCRFYAGYPITPQNEIPAYFSRRMPEVNGIFIQAESEVAAINMVFGASSTGARAMTSSSSPGISLKQEGISYLAGCSLPAVIVNVMRAGPGLGDIKPAQSDYFQATKGGGHGDYRLIVLAPSTVQEAFDLTMLSFDLADKYRNPAMILADGMLGQMMEPLSVQSLEFGAGREKLRTTNYELRTDTKPWALTGAKNRAPNIVRSLYLGEGKVEELNKELQKKYKEIEEKEQRFEAINTEDSEIILVAYGTMARLCKQIVKDLRSKGKKIGLIRPISLWPFPTSAFTKLLTTNSKLRTILVVEMSYGQMVEDVRLAVNGKCEVKFFGRAGGGIPTEEEILQQIKKYG
jgi:2-oxoglutarate ferredoxin oxidoreductase subunit alpha